MMKNGISEKILSELSPKDTVLDVGGGRFPWFRANYVLDRRSFEERIQPTAFCGRENEKEYFSKDTWIQRDIFDIPWPFKEKEIDYSVCIGTLEDIRDPIAVCKEIMRVSKRGYLSFPTRAVESCLGVGGHPRNKRWYGYYHHRWFVEVKDGELIFTHKHPLLFAYPEYGIKRVSGAETIDFFWDKEFQVRENYLWGYKAAVEDMARFKREYEGSIKGSGSFLSRLVGGFRF